MRPSTPLRQFVLRFIAIAALFGLASSAAAQSRVVRTPAAVLASPNGKAIGSVHPGIALRVLETRGAYAKVSVDGFVERARLSSQRGGSSPRVGNRTAVIRASGATSARSVASLDAGTSVAVKSSATTPSGWVRVSRDGWILKSSLDRPTSADVARAPTGKSRTASSATSQPRKASAGEVAAAPPTTTKRAAAPAPTPPTPPVVRETKSTPPAAERLADSTLVPTSNVARRAAPDARPLATVAAGTSLVPLARDRGWVRVRLEGWVPERDVAPADTAVRMGVSAADLRADPQGSRGKVVRWSVQILAKQKADALRRDLNPDETYLLARGPYEESALLYLVVPPELMATVKSMPELSQTMITARVRTGRSQLVGVPILDLLTITLRK
jgi:hypothetical protein